MWEERGDIERDKGNYSHASCYLSNKLVNDRDFFTPDKEEYGHTSRGDGSAFDPENPLDPALASKTSTAHADHEDQDSLSEG